MILLDDVFAELDAGRRQRLMTAVGDYEQVIVTAAVGEDVPSDVIGSGGWHTIRVSAGSIVEEGAAGAPS